MPTASSGSRFRQVVRILALLIGGVLLVAVLLFAWQVGGYYRQIKQEGVSSLNDIRSQASISKLVANAQVTPQDLAAVIPLPNLTEAERGPVSAKITIVEFIDYDCPFCQRAAPEIRSFLASSGANVRFIVRDFPLVDLHPGARDSALAADCVLEQNQEKYWTYNRALFDDLEHHAKADLRAKAGQVGADLKAFDACIAANRPGKKIDADIEAGLRAGVEGTPTFFVNGIKVQGALNAKQLSQLVTSVSQQLAK